MKVEVVSPLKFAVFVADILLLLLGMGGLSLIPRSVEVAQLPPSPSPTPSHAPSMTPTPTPTMTATPPLATPILLTPLNGNTNIFACKMPAEFGVVTSRYGDERENGTRHRGIDYGCVGEDVRVLSPMNGRVSFVGDLGKLGNAVIIENGGWRVILGHLAFWGVSEGQDVKAGDVLGICGSTGNSSGPHVHMEVQKWYDPWYWGTVRPKNLPGAEACEWESLKQLP